MNYIEKSALVVYWFVFKPRLYFSLNALVDSGYHLIDAFNIVYQTLT